MSQESSVLVNSVPLADLCSKSPENLVSDSPLWGDTFAFIFTVQEDLVTLEEPVSDVAVSQEFELHLSEKCDHSAVFPTSFCYLLEVP